MTTPMLQHCGMFLLQVRRALRANLTAKIALVNTDLASAGFTKVVPAWVTCRMCVAPRTVDMSVSELPACEIYYMDHMPMSAGSAGFGRTRVRAGIKITVYIERVEDTDPVPATPLVMDAEEVLAMQLLGLMHAVTLCLAPGGLPDGLIGNSGIQEVQFSCLGTNVEAVMGTQQVKKASCVLELDSVFQTQHA